MRTRMKNPDHLEQIEAEAPRPAWLEVVLLTMREYLAQRMAILEASGSLSIKDRINLESIAREIRGFELRMRGELMQLEERFSELEGCARRAGSEGMIP